MNRRLPVWVEWVAAAAILLCVQAVVFRGLILDPSGIIAGASRATVDPYREGVPRLGNDLTRLFLPHHLWTGRAVREAGRIPAWDVRGFGGRPLIGNPQAGLMYPPIWIAWISGNPSDLCRLTVAHLVLLGLGGVRLACALGLGRVGAMGAGIFLSTNPYILAQVGEGHFPHVWGAAWFPWCAASLVQGRRGDRRAWGAASIFSALGFLAGHPQEWFYFQLTIGLVVLADLARSRLKTWRAWLGLGLSWLLTLGLIAVEVVPHLMVRPWTVPVTGTGLKESARYAVRLINLQQLLDPLALGDAFNFQGPENFWETQLSIGLVPLFLLLAAVVRGRDRRRTLGLLAIVVGCVVFAAGPALGLYSVLSTAVPVIGLFRCPARMLFVSALAASVLAASGLESVGRREITLKLILMLWCWETWRYSERVIVVSPASSWISPDPISAQVGRGPVRADDVLYDDLSAAANQVEKSNVGDSFQILHASRLYRRLYRLFDPEADRRLSSRSNLDDARLDLLARRMLDLLGIPFVVADASRNDLDLPRIAEGVWNDARFRVFSNPTALPSAYVVGKAVPPRDLANPVIDFLDLDPRESVILHRDEVPSGTRQTFKPAISRNEAPDRREVEVETTDPCYLVLTTTWMPGWTATVDGRAEVVRRGNVAQCVIPLRSPGRHVVRMRYDPPGLLLGLGVTLAALIPTLLISFRKPPTIV